MSKPESSDKNELRFYCRDCEANFESEPDGTGYEQAPCPSCGAVCMTVQFEQEEQARHRNEAGVLSLFVGRVTGLFSIADKPQKPREDEAWSITDPATIRYFESTDAAHSYWEQLIQSGVNAQLVQVDGDSEPNAKDGVVLQVSSKDVEQAQQIIDEFAEGTKDETKVQIHNGQITFACEECGADITVPAGRQGGVEVCPFCSEYVDVPD